VRRARWCWRRGTRGAREGRTRGRGGGTAREGYYTTTEAAALLGLAASTVRDAVRRGRVAVERVGGRNLVAAAEIARYRAEVQGTRGWAERKAGADGAGVPSRGRPR